MNEFCECSTKQATSKKYRDLHDIYSLNLTLKINGDIFE